MVVMLSATTYLSAQSRNSNEVLEGLKGIGLVIKYGEVEGLEPAKRPTVLRLLEDRAKGWLRAAQVPFELSDEASLRGRPRLVLTITLKKPGDTPPALLVEGSLFQRIRLSRDPAKETDLATWSMGMMAPEATTELLYVFFEKLVGSFINEYRGANPTPTRIDSRSAELIARSQPNADALQGLNGVRLITSVRFIQSGSQSNVDMARLKDQSFYKKVQTEAENRLKQAGIPLLLKETERPGRPRLEIFITLGEPGLSAPAIEVGSKLWQDVQLLRDAGKQTYLSTWETQNAVSYPKDGASVISEDAVLKIVISQADEFIKAYRAANSKM
jgi:hypothetical protein